MIIWGGVSGGRVPAPERFLRKGEKMKIPKWLVGVWFAQILLNSAVHFWPMLMWRLAALTGIIPSTLVSWDYTGTVVVTIVWLLVIASAVQRFYVGLWIVALLIATLGSNLYPARPGASAAYPVLVPPIAIGIAAAITIAGLAIQRRRKLHTAQ